MSSNDRELLKSAGLSQKAVADVFGISLQGVNKGVNASSDYFTPERLGKLVDLLQPLQPEKAEILRQRLHRIAEGDGRQRQKKSFYVQLLSLLEFIVRESGNFIWVIPDPITRLAEEIDALGDAIRQKITGRMVLLIADQGETVQEILDDRVLRLDWKEWWSGEIYLVRSERIGIAPEMLLSRKKIAVKTAFEFQELREIDAQILRNVLFKDSKMTPDHMPEKLGEGYELVRRYSSSPYRRILDQVNIRLLELSSDKGPDKQLHQFKHMLRHYEEADLRSERDAPVDQLIDVLPKLVREQFNDDLSNLVYDLLLEIKISA
jgi:hypothetical protein